MGLQLFDCFACSDDYLANFLNGDFVELFKNKLDRLEKRFERLTLSLSFLNLRLTTILLQLIDLGVVDAS